MAKNYTNLWQEADEMKDEGEKLAGFKESVAKLPFELKDAFRKSQDPKLDEAINKAQSDTFGAAIKGLDMYQGISNPFTRRNLAEQYQGITEQGWKNLTDERTRRQGVYADYIDKWTGLFGAEVAKRQDTFNNKMSIWEKEKSLADTEESTRRWNIENARAEKSAARTNSTLTDAEATKKASNLKNQGWTWQDINDYLVDQYGYNTLEGSQGDNMLRSLFGLSPVKSKSAVRTGTQTTTTKKGGTSTVTQKYLYNE